MNEEQPLLEHVLELLARLRRAVLAFLAVLGAQYLMPAPGLRPLVFEAMRLIEAHLLDFEDNPLGLLAEKLGVAGVGARVIAGGVFDTLLASLYLSSTISLVAVLPYALYEVYQFAKPGLYPHEARLLRKYLALFALLFALGCAYAYLVIAPLTTLIMLWLMSAGGAEPLLTVSDLFYNFSLMLLATGAAFSLPALLVIPARLGLLSYEDLRSRWRYVVISVLLVTAAVTPDPTPVSMLLLSAPLLIDYLVALLLVKRAARAS